MIPNSMHICYQFEQKPNGNRTEKRRELTVLGKNVCPLFFCPSSQLVGASAEA